jgi:hypothetical protein
MAKSSTLPVTSPAHPLEREADRVADRVMRLTGGPGVMRSCACDDETVRRSTDGRTGAGRAGPAAGVVARSSVMPAGSGRPLDPGVRSWAEGAFGADFSSVRVHTGPSADAAATAISARAYTVGSDIVFGRGQYRPGSDTGRRLLAHELTHTLQGDVGRVARDLAVTPTEPEAANEELTADEIADALEFNRRRFRREIEIEQLRDVVGVPPSPAVVDAAFVRAVARYQAAFGLDQDGKVGPVTAAHLAREFRAEARYLGRDGRELRRQARRLDKRSFTIAVVAPARELTNTGSAEYQVRWAVSDTNADGWIIQHVTVSADKEDCAGNALGVNNGPLDFWEAWEVVDGRVYIGFRADGLGRHRSDTFRTLDEGPGTTGTVRAIGRVTFMPNYDLRRPPWGHTVAAALSLPTVQVEPVGWSDGFARRHEMIVTWNDCVAPATHEVETTP